MHVDSWHSRSSGIRAGLRLCHETVWRMSKASKDEPGFKPWPVPGLLEASEEFAPTPLPYERYFELLTPAWKALIESDESKAEAVVQNFLERHPCLLPGAFSVDGDSGHAPWPFAVVSQPMLPDLSTKRPDFMWIATDSDTTYAILIEIETPHSRWWYEKGTEVHGEFTHAQGQLAEWRAWFSKPRNQIAFVDFYELPSFLRRRKLVPRYVLIHGRRGETAEDPARLSKRRELYRDDERLMTFDRLAPQDKASDLLCVKRGADGYRLVYASPAFQIADCDTHRYVAINQWAEGLAQTYDMAQGRSDFVLREVETLRNGYSTREFGPLSPNTR